jgi:UDP:flavonoid glycosyltransferase YjiC (YdhE family)
MANILIAASPAPGHVNPMLFVAQHLSSLGHSITFLSGMLFRDQAVALVFDLFLSLERPILITCV